jgi:hypothetical protein
MKSLLIITITLLSLVITNAGALGIENQQNSDTAKNKCTGTIVIQVVDHLCDSPINHAQVYVGTYYCTKADSNGYYFIHGVPCGYHNVAVFQPVYSRVPRDSVLVIPDQVVEKKIRLVRNDSMNDDSGECYCVKLGESTVSRYCDSNAAFQIQLSLGSWGWYQRLICIVTIENRTSHPLEFLVPHIMPLCGNTNKNNIRIYNSEGAQLDIDGWHSDYIGHGPMITIDGDSFHSWAFLIDSRFRGFWQPGEYQIEFWYYFDDPIPNTWQGRVKMPRVRYLIEETDQ